MFEANLSRLEPYLRTPVIQLLRDYQNPSLSVCGSGNDGDLNLIVDGKPLYDPNAFVAAHQQVSTYLEKPRRLQFHPKAMSGLQLDTAEFADRTIHETGRLANLYAGGGEPTFGRVGSMICLGIGLGLHLPFLAYNLDFTDLILIEPDFGKFKQSLCHARWDIIADLVEKRGGKIHFIFPENASIAISAIHTFAKGETFGLFEGSFLFLHYVHPMFREIVPRLQESIQNLIAYDGWLEDEVRHLRNHIINMATYGHYVLSPEIEFDRTDRPAVIVGSGPSFDEAVESLKSVRGEVVVFSAGTSLKPLLDAGIRPDFHVELENVDLVAELIEATSRLHDLSGITLIASTTVHPYALGKFDERVLFIREGSGGMSWLAGDIPQLDRATPTCTNTALRAADVLGFTEVYLVGVDFGMKTPEGHHAAGSIYNTFSDIEGMGDATVRNLANTVGGISAPIMIPGNLGGSVHSNKTLIYMRDLFELNVDAFQGEVFNCGSGARIFGTRPCRVEALNGLIHKEKQFGSRPVDDFRERLGYREAGEGLDEEKLSRLCGALDGLAGGLYRDIDAILPSPGPDGLLVYERLRQYMHFSDPESGPGTSGHVSRAARAMYSGSLLKIYHFIRFHGCRATIQENAWYSKCLNVLKDMLPLMVLNGSMTIRRYIEAARSGLSAEAMIAIGTPQSDEMAEGAPVPGMRRFALPKRMNALSRQAITDWGMIHEAVAMLDDDAPERNVLLLEAVVRLVSAALDFGLSTDRNDKAFLEGFMMHFSKAEEILEPLTIVRCSQLLVMVGMGDQALEYAKVAYARNPADHWVCGIYASILCSTGRAGEALEIFSSLPPDLPGNFFRAFRGLSLYATGQTELGKDIWEAISGNGDTGSPIHLYFYAAALEREGHVPEAGQLRARAHKMNPGLEMKADFIFKVSVEGEAAV